MQPCLLRFLKVAGRASDPPPRWVTQGSLPLFQGSANLWTTGTAAAPCQVSKIIEGSAKVS
jgi:hypothetical protein